MFTRLITAFLFIITLATVFCQAQSTLKTVVIGVTAGTFTSTGSAQTTYSLVFRVNNVQVSKTYVNNNASPGNVINCITDATVIKCTIAAEGTPAGIAELPFTAGQDLRIRFNHQATTGSDGITTLQRWLGDCSGYSSSVKAITNIQSLPMSSAPWSIGPSINGLAFLRLYPAVDTSTSCPVDAPVATTELFAFPFENVSGGTLVASVGGYTMSATGSSYANSTSYPPSASITGWSTYLPVFPAMVGQPFSGATSVSFTYPGTGAVSSSFWTQLSGPTQSIFSSRTSATPTITPPLAGQYVYQLTVADSNGDTATDTQTVGAVATDTNSVVITANDEFRWVLGDVLMHGRSPWPWYEVTEAADANLLSSLMSTPPTQTAGPGTCTIPSGSPNQISDGRITALTYAGVTVVCSGSNFTIADQGTRITLNWDPDGDGSFKGHFVGYIQCYTDGACSGGGGYVSATTVFLSDNYELIPTTALATGKNWARLNSTFGPYNAGDSGSFILNFYEAGLAVGRLYAKTGLTTYQTQFHSFCDNWWRWALQSGYAFGVIPRNSGLHLMLACAADPTYTKPLSLANIWDGVAFLTKAIAPASVYNLATGDSDVGYNPTHTAVKALGDVRENSYILRPSAILARYYGNHGGSGSTWCTYLQNQVVNRWNATVDVPTGGASTNLYWSEFLFYENPSYPTAGDPPITGPYGTSPWRSSGLPTNALIYGYEALSDTSACNDPTTAALVYNPTGPVGLIPYATNFVWNYGREAGGGLDYSVGYTSDYGVDSTPVAGAGTLAVTSNGTGVVGTGTAFTTLFNPCDGTKYIGIYGSTGTNRVVGRVTACPDDTHLTLNSVWPGSTQSGLATYYKANQSFTNCGPLSLASWCNPDPFPGGGRNLSADISAGAAWLFKKTSATSHRDRVDYYNNKLFGGASGGAGSTGAATGTAIYSRLGTVNVTNASTTVVGVGTNFTAQFSPCDGTTSITITDTTSAYTWAAPPNAPTYYTRVVASCADATHLTLSTSYPGSTQSGLSMFYNPTDTQWPGADGGVGNLGEILPDCGSNPAPCGINDLVPKYGKPLGMASGAGNIPVALADRLGGLASLTTLPIVIRGAFPTGGDKMRCTVTVPDGTITVTTSASGVPQCGITPDARQGGVLVTVSFLNASAATISTSDPFIYQ